MTKEQAYSQLLETITNDNKHADYPRVTALAEDYRILITGKDIATKLKRFNPREDEEMFKQRVALTIATTPAVASSIKKPFNKVPRTQPVTRKITAKEKTGEAAVAEIEDRIKKFYGAENNIGGLDYYLQNRFVDLSFRDPNSWIVIEFDAFDPNTEKASPRPFEVMAKDAINFSIRNNIVEWLIVCTDITYDEKVDGKVEKKDGKKYTIYSDNDAWTFEETSADATKRVLKVSGEQLLVIEKRGTFVVNHFEMKAGKVPAFRVGYIPDIETNGRTYVNPFHDALCYFDKSIKQVSEFDLSTCLHTFPQKIVRLTKQCPGDGVQRCDRGRFTDGTICGTCKGTGIPIHSSGQDVIMVELPDSKDELIPLSDYVYYVPLPIELLKLQKEWVDSLSVDCHQAVFNSTALLRITPGTSVNAPTPMAPTATQQNDNMESVYDTLAPFGEKVSSVWQSIVELIAILTDNKDKATIIHRFPSNFKLKTRQDLYNERKALQDSGAPAFTIDAVDDELAADIYADDKDEHHKYLVKKDHYPFVGKTVAEVAQLLASTVVLKKTKVLYSYFDEIFTELEREAKKTGGDFYTEKVEERQAKIDEKVAALMEQLTTENQTAFAFKMAAITNADKTNVDGAAA